MPEYCCCCCCCYSHNGSIGRFHLYSLHRSHSKYNNNKSKHQLSKNTHFQPLMCVACSQAIVHIRCSSLRCRQNSMVGLSLGKCIRLNLYFVGAVCEQQQFVRHRKQLYLRVFVFFFHFISFSCCDDHNYRVSICVRPTCGRAPRMPPRMKSVNPCWLPDTNARV